VGALALAAGVVLALAVDRVAGVAVALVGIGLLLPLGGGDGGTETAIDGGSFGDGGEGGGAGG
jgi:hypothetical protein